MIIICGAGSKLAKNTIQYLSKNHNLVTISRFEKYSGKNITNINVENYNDVPNIIKELAEKNYVWVNFVAHSSNNLLVNTDNASLIKDQDLNFNINFQASKILIPKMIANKYGRFIFISSSRALLGDIGIFSYSYGKRANLSLQNQIVIEYSRFGITANTLSLGFFDTKLWQSLDKKIRNNLLKRVPSGKFLTQLLLHQLLNLLLIILQLITMF